MPIEPVSVAGAGHIIVCRREIRRIAAGDNYAPPIRTATGLPAALAAAEVRARITSGVDATARAIDAQHNRAFTLGSVRRGSAAMP